MLATQLTYAVLTHFSISGNALESVSGVGCVWKCSLGERWWEEVSFKELVSWSNKVVCQCRDTLKNDRSITKHRRHMYPAAKHSRRHQKRYFCFSSHVFFYLRVSSRVQSF